jgi:hypothetical protein
MTKPIEHIIIPDVQTKDGVPTKHLKWAGQYIIDHKPDKVICIGDFADMPSLSSYDRGKKGFEGRRYWKDVKATKKAMGVLMAPINEYNRRQRLNKKSIYKPEFHMFLGNHEHRISRATENDAVLDGTISVDDLGYAKAGWKVHQFLATATLDGVTYSHFFPRSGNGRVMQNSRGAPSARTQALREMRSCVAGHMQGLDFNVHQLGDRRIYNIIAGSFYLHDEDYLTPQGTEYWRGIIHLFDVHGGMFDPLFLSIEYLERRYGKRS